jgi:UDPglucose 6-dehydrogenase
MNIAVIGTGYVGLVQGTCFAETGNNVTCMDIDEKKIAQLKKRTSPIYEPGLEELVKKNIKEGRLHFTTVIKNAVESSDVIFLCLPTPPSEDGSADLTHVLEVAKHVGKYINGYKILVSKSTVPVGTVDRIKKLIKDVSKYPIDVVSGVFEGRCSC